MNLTNRKSEPLRQTVSFISKSHFLDAPYYVKTINQRTGIRDPDRDLDDQWFYVEPRTGAMFRRWLAYQVTLGVFPLANRSNQPFGKITEQKIPYYQLTVDAHATDDQLSDLKANLATLDTAIDISIYGGASLAIVCFGVMLWLVYRRKHRQQEWERHGRQQKQKQKQNGKQGVMSPSQALMHGASAGPIGSAPHQTDIADSPYNPDGNKFNNYGTSAVGYDDDDNGNEGNSGKAGKDGYIPVV